MSLGTRRVTSHGSWTCVWPQAVFSLPLCSANLDAIATAYSLPFEAGGHRVLLPENENIKTTMLDITMLAAHLNMDDIPEGHPDFDNFFPKQFSEGREFDIVLCDGQMLRTQPRAD